MYFTVQTFYKLWLLRNFVLIFLCSFFLLSKFCPFLIVVAQYMWSLKCRWRSKILEKSWEMVIKLNCWVKKFKKLSAFRSNSTLKNLLQKIKPKEHYSNRATSFLKDIRIFPVSFERKSVVRFFPRIPW